MQWRFALPIQSIHIRLAIHEEEAEKKKQKNTDELLQNTINTNNKMRIKKNKKIQAQPIREQRSEATKPLEAPVFFFK